MKDKLELPKLSLQEFNNSARNRFLEVFNNPCPLVTPFTSKMNSRFIIINEGQPIDTRLFMSIISIAKSMGDNGFYFSFVEVYDYKIWYPGMEKEIYLQSWFIPFEKVIDYQIQTFFTNHVVYSEHGNWGVFVHVDDFLLMGGVSEFMSQIFARHTNLDAGTDNFIQTWKKYYKDLHYSLGWIPEVLEHIYGKEKAKLLIQKHELK